MFSFSSPFFSPSPPHVGPQWVNGLEYRASTKYTYKCGEEYRERKTYDDPPIPACVYHTKSIHYTYHMYVLSAPALGQKAKLVGYCFPPVCCLPASLSVCVCVCVCVCDRILVLQQPRPAPQRKSGGGPPEIKCIIWASKIVGHAVNTQQ